MNKNSGIVIRQMTEDDVPTLVDLHLEVFKGYDNTMMGVGYLKSLYRTLACDSSCISIVALKAGNISGWIGGVKDWMSFEKALIQCSMFRAPAIFISTLINKPELLTKALSVVWRVFRDFIIHLGQQNPPYNRTPASQEAALLVIGVTPQRQSQGLGRLMMDDFHRRLVLRGFATSSASTFVDNESGNRAFQKAGYQFSWTHDGVNHYVKHLTEESSD